MMRSHYEGPMLRAKGHRDARILHEICHILIELIKDVAKKQLTKQHGKTNILRNQVEVLEARVLGRPMSQKLNSREY